MPDAFRALAAQPDEPLWRRIGRIVGDLLSLLYGIGGITTGGGMAGAGGLVCAAGVAAGGVGEVATCPVSLPLLVGGAALAVYGGGVALTSVQDLLAQLGVVLKAAAGGDDQASEPTSNLTPEQAKNFQRYVNMLPKGAKDVTIRNLPNGEKEFSANVPGKVPGSYAIYTKMVDAAGTTTSYVKTTYAPDGSIVHVKIKF